jgi:hypothetical protein
MTVDTNWCEKAIQLLIKARGSSWGNTGSTPYFESGESPVSHESSKIPIPNESTGDQCCQRVEKSAPKHKGDRKNLMGPGKSRAEFSADLKKRAEKGPNFFLFGFS